ncbi:hypothetical protein [Saccharopolyspora rosea]|uniref:Uncharacterized protein n=1 Tax=Saccharopolyspora rosea TaxID=524884 RepID=A0ABW3G111_9PSEU|nr:hypothetical protein [Saccharopolyspora rosea]
MGKLSATLEALGKLASELSGAVAEMQDSFPADPTTYLRSEGYLSELRATAESAGLSVFEEDGRLLCPPAVVRVRAEHAALEVDGERDHRLRPSVVVQSLADHQRSRPKFRYAAFFNSILDAYDLIVAQRGARAGSVVRLVDIWRLLTLLPGQDKEYTKQEFTRDLYLLDDSGITGTMRTDRKLRWCASTGTRGNGVLSTVGRDGRRRQYWGVSFVEPAA